MNRILFFLFLFFFSCQNSGHQIDIVVTSKTPLQKNEKIYISGNQPILGGWNGSEIALKPQGEKWLGRFSFPKGTELEFKFTRGNWDKEAVDAEGNIPGNHIHKVEKPTALEFTIENWKDNFESLPSTATGKIDTHIFQPDGLPERKVLVRVPVNYSEENNIRYPVLYMHDAQNVFDVATAYAGKEWQADEWLDSLSVAGKIEPFIIVAIENSEFRQAEYSDTDKGKLYQNFLIKKLKPFIDSVYLTKPEREFTATMGSSMGGLVSFILAWEHSDVFSRAACFSPAFKYNGFDYTKKVVETKDNRRIDLYLDNGTEGLEEQLQPGIDEMMKVLREKKQPFSWYLDKGAHHNEEAWAKRMWRPLIQFYGK